jgi:HAD superfamily hydrolase (TIGR01509 family)
VTAAILFDLEGVLADLDPGAAEAFFGRLLPVRRSELELAWERWQAEHLGPDDAAPWARFWDSLGGDLGLSPSARRRLQEFDYGGLYRAHADARPALRRARRFGLRTAILSNHLLAEPNGLLERLGLAELVDAAFFPADAASSKPARAAYQRALTALGVAPMDCLLLDDSATHVLGARRLGIQAYRLDRGKTSPDVLSSGVVSSLAALPAILEAGPV